MKDILEEAHNLYHASKANKAKCVVYFSAYGVFEYDETKGVSLTEYAAQPACLKVLDANGEPV